jgi:RecA-family ATPase
VATTVNARLAVPTVDSDFNDMARAGLDVAEALKQAITVESGKKLVCIDADDFLQREFPPRECLLSPWLPKQGITMIHATRGTGKTHVSLGIAYAMASGGEFLGWKADKPCGVLFVDGEMPANLLQERLAMIAASSDKDGLMSPLRILTPDMQEFGMPDLATMDGQQAIEQHVTDDIDCIIVDNLATLVRIGKENESESWQPIQTWALIHRAKGRSVVFIRKRMGNYWIDPTFSGLPFLNSAAVIPAEPAPI